MVKPQRGRIVLPDDFVKQYESIYPFPNALSESIVLRTYSQWLPEEVRRENWHETVKRAVQYSLDLYTGPASDEELIEEAKEFFDHMFHLGEFTSGRTMWIGGRDLAWRLPTANFNCSFQIINELECFHDLFYLLMMGCGGGGKITTHEVDKLPPFRTNISLIHEPYKWNRSGEGETTLEFESGFAYLTIGDSREGWCQGLQKLLEILTVGHPDMRDVFSISINYNNVRPEGERLKYMGGKASGHEPLKRIFEVTHRVITEEAPRVQISNPYLTEEYKALLGDNISKLEPINALDICNVIGEGAQMGGVRRSSEIMLFDFGDKKVREAKVGLYVLDEKTQKYVPSPIIGHRRNSNNSIFFTEKPTLEDLKEIMQSVKVSAEPGFYNAVAAALRRVRFEGTNPCGEILLDHRGFCNLATSNAVAWLSDTPYGKVIDINKAKRSLRRITRHCLRITNVDIELPKWDEVQKRDRLLGVNVSGWEDCFDASATGQGHIGPYLLNHPEKGPTKGFDGRKLRVFDIERGGHFEMTVDELKMELRAHVHKEGRAYADEMGVPHPLLMTTGQPGGTLPKVPSISPGCSRNRGAYYIRRVRYNKTDALAEVLGMCGYPVYPEFAEGTTIFSRNPSEFDALEPWQQQQDLNSVSVWVVEFPMKSLAKTRAVDEDARDQLYRYLSYQNFWTDHNTSVTIYVGDDEWDELTEAVHRHWDDGYIGISFSQKDMGSSMYILVPEEDITAEEYERRAAGLKRIDRKMLNDLEAAMELTADQEVAGMQPCEGACALPPPKPSETGGDAGG